MSEKTDINEIENNSPTEKPDEVAKGKKKSRKKKDRPVERKIIKKIVRVVKETETVKPEEPLEDKASLTNEAGEEKANEKKEKKPSKRKKRWPFILLLILLLLVGILWYASPYIRIYTGNYLYNQERYEDAIALVKGMTENEEAMHIIEDCDYKIAERTADYILSENKELKELGLKLERVYDQKNSLDYKGKNEVTSFVAEYVNDRFTYRGSYIANTIKRDDGTWDVTVYSQKDHQIIPVKKPSKVMAGSAIVEEYPEARYKETRQISESEVVYVFEMFSWEKPLYKTGYEITANCSYDIKSDSWKLGEVQKELKESEAIPFKKFVTSIFTIELPETWVITINEEIETKKDRTTEYKEYKYSYAFYADMERGTELMNISVHFSPENQSSFSIGKNTITGKRIGNGTYSENNNTYSLTFKPKIREMNSTFSINGYGISKEELQKIIDSIIIVDHHYKLTVIPEGMLNIRDTFSSKTGKVVAQAKQGDKFMASRAIFNEGYTWFDVAEGKWIPDKDGDWLLIE